jgi:hypothetical protein
MNTIGLRLSAMMPPGLSQGQAMQPVLPWKNHWVGHALITSLP